MIDYVTNMLNELPDDLMGNTESATPAPAHLFEVDAQQEKLPKEQAEMFHHIVAKTLFLCKRARPDLQTAVAFLSTRVKAPDLDDYKKLRKMIQYMRATRDLYLTLEGDSMSVIKWWVDGSFAVHPDMRSHTGAVMSLGKGAIYSTSKKHKLNTTSSTEAELVSVNDVMPQVLWTRYFLQSQGYNVTDNVIFQDNQSTILLEKNGKASSGKRTRHINIRYFFITDRINAAEVRVSYCPTAEMLADFFTKPLQGSLFRRLRDFILNLSASYVPPTPSMGSGPQECVGG